MKTLKASFGSAPLGLLLLLLAGCAPSPQAGPSEPIVIEPLMRVGPVQAGMSVDQAVAALGEPQRRSANALEYTDHGFALMPGPDKIVQVVMCGDVTGPNGPFAMRFNGRTKEGIGMKSTRAEVLQALGQPTSAESFPGGRESLKYQALGLTFTLENGKVHHIIVRLTGTPPPPDAVEIVPQ